MSRDKKLVLGVVVLAALSGLVYRQMNQDAKVGTQTAAQTDLPDIKTPDDVDKISLTNADKGEVVLEKQGDKWMVTKPVKALANQTSVKSLIDNMKEIKAKEVISPTVDDNLKKEYNLTPNLALHVVAYKGAEKKSDNWFGKTGSRGEMMMVEGKPAVYGATGYSSYLYNRTANEWREKEMLKFDDANVTNVSLENKTGKFSFTKGDKWAATLNGKPLERFDEERIKDLLRVYKALNADDFADDKKTLADIGLDGKPEATLEINLKDNAGHFVVKVGRGSQGNAHYAMKENDPVMYVIGMSPSDWALADDKKFQKPSGDAGAAKDPTATAPKPMQLPPGMGMPPGHP